MSRQRDEIVIITADLVCRFVMSDKFVARDFGQPQRQKAALDHAGQFQIEIKPLTGQFKVTTVLLQVDLQAAELQVRFDPSVYSSI